MTMTLDSANVRVAVTGVVSVAPSGSTAPADGDSTLDTAFKDLGYAGEGGVTETRDRSSNAIKAWQNGDTVREVVTEGRLSFQTVLLETKKETVELYYGTTVDGTDGSIVIVPTKTGGRKAFVLDVIDGDDFIRTYIPQGEVTEVGSQVYANGEPIGYEVTITAYPDSSIPDADGNAGSAIKWYSSLVAP
jgi:hypothetical protein